MNTIVWSAVFAAALGAASIIAAIAGGPHELVISLGFGGIIAAMLTLNSR